MRKGASGALEFRFDDVILFVSNHSIPLSRFIGAVIALEMTVHFLSDLDILLHTHGADIFGDRSSKEATKTKKIKHQVEKNKTITIRARLDVDRTVDFFLISSASGHWR